MPPRRPARRARRNARAGLHAQHLVRPRRPQPRPKAPPPSNEGRRACRRDPLDHSRRGGAFHHRCGGVVGAPGTRHYRRCGGCGSVRGGPGAAPRATHHLPAPPGRGGARAVRHRRGAEAQRRAVGLAASAGHRAGVGSAAHRLAHLSAFTARDRCGGARAGA